MGSLSIEFFYLCGISSIERTSCQSLWNLSVSHLRGPDGTALKALKFALLV